MEKIITIDIGTSSVKVALFDIKGNMLQLQSSPYSKLRYDGFIAEQDANEWWNLTRALVKKITGKLGSEKSDIRAIGITGQMHGAVLVGKGKVLTPVMNYQDRRAMKEHLQLLHHRELFYNRTGALLDVNMIPEKMLYISHNDPLLMEQTEWLFAPKDYIRFELTGEAATEPIDAAGFLLFNLNTGKWDEELCELSKIDINKLPEIRQTISKAANLKKDIASELGLPADAIVSIGGGDDIETLGSGTDFGDLYEHLGSSGSICVTTNQRIYDGQLRIETFPDILPGRYLVGGSTSAAGAADKWFRENICDISDNLEETFQRIVNTKKPSEVTFLPFLSGARCPIWDPERSGAFVGLTLGHKAEHLFQAVAEGVAYSLRDIIEYLNGLGFGLNGSLYTTGGFGTTPSYGQIRADIYHCPVKRVNKEEATGFAAMLIAGTTAGIFDDVLKTAVSLRRLAWEAQPRSEVLTDYDKAYQKYRDIQNRLAGV